MISLVWAICYAMINSCMCFRHQFDFYKHTGMMRKWLLLMFWSHVINFVLTRYEVPSQHPPVSYCTNELGVLQYLNNREDPSNASYDLITEFIDKSDLYIIAANINFSEMFHGNENYFFKWGPISSHYRPFICCKINSFREDLK